MSVKGKRIEIIIGDDLWVAAKVKAVHNHLSLSAVIRMLLKRWVEAGSVDGGTSAKKGKH